MRLYKNSKKISRIIQDNKKNINNEAVFLPIQRKIFYVENGQELEIDFNYFLNYLINQLKSINQIYFDSETLVTLALTLCQYYQVEKDLQSNEKIFLYDAIKKICYSCLTNRIINWLKRDRTIKKSDAFIKRKKAFFEMGEKADLLMFTHTAPIINKDATKTQSKDYYTNKRRISYYRTGENEQRFLLKILSGRKIFYLTKKLHDLKIEQKQRFIRTLTPIKGTQKFRKGLRPGKKDNILKLNVYVIANGSRSRNIGSMYGAEANSYTFYYDVVRPYFIHNPSKNEIRANNYIDDDMNLFLSYVRRDFNTHKPDKYYDLVINNSRKCINECKSLGFNEYQIVNSPDGFLQYPCLVVDFRDQKKIDINSIIDQFSKSGIVLEYRNSFGFRHPSISILTTSIRIWPGLLDPKLFAEIISSIFCQQETKENSMEIENYVCLDSSIIYRALITSVRFISNIYNKIFSYELWLSNRILSNMIKANFLIERAKNNRVYTSEYKKYYLEACQVIENLNEYGLQLINGLNEEINIEQVKSYYGESIGELSLTYFMLTNSGMNAGMIAQELAAKQLSCNLDSYPPCSYVEHQNLYFEFMSLPQRGKESNSILMFDPAYNFTCINETEKMSNIEFQNRKILIIDITNMTSEDIKSYILNIKSRIPEMCSTIYLFGSLSKHFQIGMDRFTLGVVLKYTTEKEMFSCGCNVHNNLKAYYNQMLKAQL